MAGLFDKLTGGAAAQTPSTRNPAEGGLVAGATPEQVQAAIARLKAKGLTKITKADIAEEIALGGDEAPAAPAGEPMVGRAVLGGSQPSPEMLQRVKAMQDAKNREVLERAMARRRAESGAR